LNTHRIAEFGLRGIFVAFFSSSWLGLRKPDPRLYQLALALLQATPTGVLFVDDREPNLAPARALGMRVHRHTTTAALEAALRSHGIL
jgi:putative hydrolase of the HAD superfamily